MKKQIISVFLVFGLVCMLFISAMETNSNSSKVELWGEAVQEYVTSPIGEDAAVLRSLDVAVDNKITLPQIEINQAKDFYIIAGYGESEAYELAITYVKEINALYQEAIKNGYTVTEDEISAYLEQLKTEFNSAGNSEEIYSFINSFESEEEYWNFQFEMLKKDLPIQKYVAAMESEFVNASISNVPATETYDATSEEVQGEWERQFENMKDIVKTSYSYSIE